jgi:hypothetical protein
MRKIKLTPVEFYRFRRVAFLYGVLFMCSISDSVYTVEAKDDKLEQIGY